MDNKPVSANSVGPYFGVSGKQLEEQYRMHLSGFHDWGQLKHASDWILFEDNLGEYLSIDETSLSHGELYTVLTNKSGKGKKGALVGMFKGTGYETVKEAVMRIPAAKRLKVKEVTLDMAANMEKIVRVCFPKATRVTDRFHVQQLAGEAVQEMRIAFRWKAIEQENKEIELSRELGKTFRPHVLENGDTPKQLLARSRYLLFKSRDKWTPSQHHRAEILFHRHPDLEKAYNLSRELSHIYTRTKEKGVGFTRLAKWYDKVEKAGFDSFNAVSRTIQNHYSTILNYFDNRSTNASAEAFNAKIKAFRRQLRGVNNIPYFLFRLSNIYA